MLETSIIIVTHNSAHHLDGCLNSLRTHTNLDDAEIIVVDNASTDNTVSIIESKYPDVTLIRNSVNNGYSHGNNLGARHSRGEYLVFLNPDTVVAEGWLIAFKSALAGENVGLVTPKMLLLSDPTRINACGHQVHITGIVQCRNIGLKADKFQTTEEVDAISGAAFGIKREVFKELGGLDASFFLYIEDSDISWRAWSSGYRCLYVPNSVIYHDYHLRFGPKKLYYFERNRYRLLLRNLRWGTLLVLAPALFLGEIVAWGFVVLYDRAHWRNKLLAYKWLRKNWRAVMSERKRIQAQRSVLDRELLKHCTHRLNFKQTGDRVISNLAGLFFNPLFYIFKTIVRVLVWW
jgi:GT2 family glycosyltransferase